MNRNLFGWRVQFCTGAALTLMSRAAVRLDAVRHSVKAWLDQRTRPSGELRGGDALKAYRRFAGYPAGKMRSPELREVVASIIGPDRIVTRT